FDIECDNTNTSYEVILTISGGSGTYFVDGDPVTGTVYRAGPYPSGSGPYTFEVTDDAGCTREVTTLPRDCDCETIAGQLSSGDLTACEGDGITVNIVTPSTSDGDDIEGLWIFDNQANPLNSLIEFVTGTTIAFDPGLYTPGQSYYVALAVGNNDGSGIVDLQGDACAALSNVVEIIWAERPEAEIDGPDQLVLSCGQTDLILRTTGSSPQTADYQWILEQGASTNDPLTGPTLTVGSPGTYILELRTGDGSCVDRDEVTVIADQDLPTVILNQDGPLTCAQESVILDGSASDFGSNFEAEWELPDGSVLTGQGLTLTVNEEGTYRLTITNLDNACSNSAEVTVSANIQLPLVDAGEDEQFTCGVTTIELNASVTGTTGSTSVVWYLDGVVIPGATSLSLTAMLPGTYRVEVEDNATGCLGQDVVQLTEDIGTIGSADVETMRPSCPGERDGSIIVANVTGGTAPYQYSINNNPFTTFPEFQLLRAGTYELEIRDANDCRYSETVELEDGSSVQVQMGADTVIDIGDELILQPIIYVENPDDVIAIDTIYISFVDSLSCTRCANPFAIIEPTVPANYVVTVITESGCEVSDARFVGVNLEKPPFFIPTAFSPNGDGVNDRVELSFREPELVESVNEFVIYNRWGNLMYREASVIPGKRIQLWDGDFNGKPMLPQVFVYSFQVKYKDGSEEVFKGDITLFR
ncbi:MAG TPA: gliding motility-associated C-terminal domain-containing protein, partial [Saprospiraceae bacterium]|nr:gliding motility-associated C-terminal domain-containing protein [Saprospiraceae bacterium]